MTIFQNANLYELTRSAVLLQTGVTLPWSDEPTGVSYNPSSHHLYVSHDTGSATVYDVDPGPDADYGTGDDTSTSSTPVHWASVTPRASLLTP